MKINVLRFAIGLTLLTSLASSFAASGPAAGAATTMTPHASVMTPMMTEETICPAPYSKFTSGMDASKGESLCVKSAGTCADGYVSQRNDLNGQLTCIPNTPVPAPLGWSAGPGHGVYVFNSIPQPIVKCPKATKDWQWGTRYYTESWNRMGCIANLKPAY